MHQNLAALMQRDPQLDFLVHLLELAKRYVDPERVILFGSRARGDAKRVSDVDVAFAFNIDKAAHWGSFCAEADDQMPTLLSMDLVNLAEADPPLLTSIQREGVLIYERAHHSSAQQS